MIPHIDNFLDDGQTKEEWKMQVETQKILDKKIQVSATCVRVPVFIGHGESVNIEFEKEISEDKLREVLILTIVKLTARTKTLVVTKRGMRWKISIFKLKEIKMEL